MYNLLMFTQEYCYMHSSIQVHLYCEATHKSQNFYDFKQYVM